MEGGTTQPSLPNVFLSSGRGGRGDSVGESVSESLSGGTKGGGKAARTSRLVRWVLEVLSWKYIRRLMSAKAADIFPKGGEYGQCADPPTMLDIVGGIVDPLDTMPPLCCVDCNALSLFKPRSPESR